MAPTTEYLLLHLHDNVKTPLAEDATFADMMKTVRNQPNCERLLWGQSKEDPKKLYWIIDWTTLADHEAFMKLDWYPEFVKKVKSYGGPQGMEMLHFDFQPSAPYQIINSDTPLLEVLAIDLKAGIQAAEIEAAFDPFQAAMSENGVKIIRAAAIENSNKVVAMIAWASVESHMAARETEGFKSTIGPVRNLWESVTLNHVQLEEYKL